MRRKRILLFASISGLGIPAFALPLQHQEPETNKSLSKNILFVIFDDLRPELGCYGNPHMFTPNIDAVAEEGVVFQRAYVQQAVSSASRASFLTGCRPDITGVDYPYSEYFVNEFLPKHPTIQKYMFENGFYTRTLGKIHHGLGGMGEIFSEEHFIPTNPSFAIEENQRRLSIDKKLTPIIECADVPDNKYADGAIADEAVKTIHSLKRKNKYNKPFFISVGFLKPHIPFCAPKKYFDMYNLDSIPLTPNPYHNKNVTRYSEAHFALKNWAGERDTDTTVISERRQRELRQAYFACVSYVDAQFGKIIQALKEEGLYENTSIVIIGDHGWHLGDNGMYGKSDNFERAIHTPMIIKIPDNRFASSQKSESFVEFVDLYPTICELGEVKTPDYIEGTSLLPLLKNPARKWKSAAFSQFPRDEKSYGNRIVEGYSIRTQRYHYIEWRKKENDEIMDVELYDHNNDPNETENIAYDNLTKVKELSALLHKGWKNALPDGIRNDSNNELAPPSIGWGPEAKKRRESNNFLTR